MAEVKFWDFVTEDGIVLKCRRPNRFDVLKLERRFIRDEPFPPKKEVDTAFGKEEIPDPDDVDYVMARTTWLMEYSVARSDFLLLDYVIVDIPANLPEIEASYRRLARSGTPAPYDLKDPDDKKLAYLRSILPGTQQAEMATFLNRLMGATEEEVEAAEETFPGDVAGTSPDG